jgi:lactobin A/cerein 7B family class IIb bacteriocin
MKRDIKKMKELDLANLDEVSGGIGPLAVGLYMGGAALAGWIGKTWYDSSGRAGPQSVRQRPDTERRICDGRSRQNVDGSRSFQAEGCRKMGLW